LNTSTSAWANEVGFAQTGLVIKDMRIEEARPAISFQVQRPLRPDRGRMATCPSTSIFWIFGAFMPAAGGVVRDILRIVWFVKFGHTDGHALSLETLFCRAG